MGSKFDAEKLPHNLAQSDFEVAVRKGFWRAVAGWFRLVDTQLEPFDKVIHRYKLRSQHAIGMRDVRLDQVVGSVGRYKEFDSIFLPRQTRTRERWIRIDEAHLRDIPLPAIELYKVGDRYYVIDGNHRVSVARERGQKYIDAYVIEMDFVEPFEDDLDLIERIRLKQRIDFHEQTNLKTLLDVQIELSLAGGYNKLLEHIRVHRWFLGEQHAEEISWEQAVRSWYSDVYTPLIQVIRENKVIKDFPGRTEADLYLWIIEHLWYLREAYHREVSVRDAAEHFKEEFSKRPIRTMLKFLRRILKKKRVEH